MSDQRCPQCRTMNKPGAKFCHRCGKNLAPAPAKQPHRRATPGTCPACGFVNRASAKHCVRCGRSLQPAAAPVPAVPQPKAGRTICPHCRKENRAGAKFCLFCGQPIHSPPPGQPVPGTRQRALSLSPPLPSVDGGDGHRRPRPGTKGRMAGLCSRRRPGRDPLRHHRRDRLDLLRACLPFREAVLEATCAHVTT